MFWAGGYGWLSASGKNRLLSSIGSHRQQMISVWCLRKFIGIDLFQAPFFSEKIKNNQGVVKL